MPLQRVEIRHFAEGRRGDRNPSDLPEGACPSGSNVAVDRDSIKVRPGYVVHSAWPAAPATGGTSLAEYLPTADCTVTTKRFVAGMGANVFATDAAGETFGGAPLDVGPAIAWSANRKRFAQFGKHMYCVDGSGPARRFFNLGGALESDVDELAAQQVPQGELTLILSENGTSDYLMGGQYQFACAFVGRSYESGYLEYKPTGPLGKVASVIVGSNKWRQILVNVPTPDAVWTTDEDHMYFAWYAKTPYHAEDWKLLRAPAITGETDGWPHVTTVFAGTKAYSYAITAGSRVANVITFTAAGHTFVVGQGVRVTGCPAGGLGTDFNGYFVVTGVAVGTFTVADVAVNDNFAAAGGTADIISMFPADDTAATSVKDTWHPAPPSGATLLIEYLERMVYALPHPYSRTGTADTLYISRLGDATHCTIDPVAYPTDEEGAWAQVGEDGRAVTGLAKLGSYLIATKASGVWALAWNGPQDFLLSQVSTLAGCASHETMVNVDGTLFFLGHDTVWRMDGAFNITDIGQPVADLIAAYTVSQREGAFAAFDPVNRRYLIGFNDTKWLSYSLKTQRWDPQWAGLADGCMIWAQGVTTPGLYAGTETAGAGDGIWRLAGTVDGDDEAISFQWDSPEFDVPAGRYKDIGRVDVSVLDCDLLGASLNVNDASFATPIVVTTAGAHSLVTGDRVRIAGVTGNTAANGDWTVTFVAANQVSLDTSVGNGAYAGAGTLREMRNRAYAALLRNGATSEYASQELVPAADATTPQALKWWPAPVGDADRYQLRVRGTAKAALEIGTLVLHVKDVGGI